jgi:hypothetical protein
LAATTLISRAAFHKVFAFDVEIQRFDCDIAPIRVEHMENGTTLNLIEKCMPVAASRVQSAEWRIE